MAQSGLKQFWNSLKPPPAAPRRDLHGPTKHPSGIRRLWNTLKPPPAVPVALDELPTKDRLRRRRLLTGVIVVALAGAAAWGIYLYIDSAPSRAEKAYQDGRRLMGSNNLSGAEDRFTKAIGIWPQLAPAYLERGLARKAQNHVDAAREDFESAIRQDAGLGAAHTELGLIFRERGDFNGAMNEFTVAINTSPNTDAFYQRGQAYESIGEHEKAIQDYDAAIHEQPDAPFVYRARAMSRDALGDAEGAAEDRREAHRIERHP